jgi:hypothetical protein
MKAFAFEILSRIISPEVGAGTGAGAWVVSAAVCAETNVIKLNKTKKSEEQNLLNFSGIFSPPFDLNFP